MIGPESRVIIRLCSVMELHHPIMSKLWDPGGRTKRKNRQCTFNHGGKYHTLSIRDKYLVNNLTLVAYQGKPVSLTLARKPNGMMFDHVLTIYNSTPDNEGMLNL